MLRLVHLDTTSFVGWRSICYVVFLPISWFSSVLFLARTLWLFNTRIVLGNCLSSFGSLRREGYFALIGSFDCVINPLLTLLECVLLYQQILWNYRWIYFNNLQYITHSFIHINYDCNIHILKKIIKWSDNSFGILIFYWLYLIFLIELENQLSMSRLNGGSNGNFSCIQVIECECLLIGYN